MQFAVRRLEERNNDVRTSTCQLANTLFAWRAL
jgi:hypothetical protein